MNARTQRSLALFVALCGLATVSWLIFLGYLSPEMLVYYLTFQWCF